MSILSELLNSIKSTSKTQIVKQICDTIFEEEKSKFIYAVDLRPRGPNIFLSLECPETPTLINYLCLEREEQDRFILSTWVIKKDPKTGTLESAYAIRKSAIQLDPNLDPERILQEYAKKFKFMKGE